jgi:hypothetical protein
LRQLAAELGLVLRAGKGLTGPGGHQVRRLSPPGYPGDLPCPTKGTAIQSHNDEDQSM